MYKCKCGKEFNSIHSLSGHKSHCKDCVGDEKVNQYNHIRHELRNRSYSNHIRDKKQQELQRWLSEQHHCENCGKLMTEYYGSGRFCSRSCSNGYNSKHQSEEARRKKIEALARGNETQRHIKEETGKFTSAKLRICTICNSEFNSNKYNICPKCRRRQKYYDILDRDYMMIISKEFNFVEDIELSKHIDVSSIDNYIKSVKDYSENVIPISRIVRQSSCVPGARELIAKYLVTNSTWQLADRLGISQRSLYDAIKSFNFSLKYKCSSRAHLRIKPIIENIIGYHTISEYCIYVNNHKYIIDEYSSDLNIAFEIDGDWCHNRDHDLLRDKDLMSIGIKTIRIPSDIKDPESFIINKLDENT